MTQGTTCSPGGGGRGGRVFFNILPADAEFAARADWVTATFCMVVAKTDKRGMSAAFRSHVHLQARSLGALQGLQQRKHVQQVSVSPHSGRDAACGSGQQSVIVTCVCTALCHNQMQCTACIEWYGVLHVLYALVAVVVGPPWHGCTTATTKGMWRHCRDAGHHSESDGQTKARPQPPSLRGQCESEPQPRTIVLSWWHRCCFCLAGLA